MPAIASISLSTSLIGAGALAWVFTGRPLTANADLDVPLNPLGINRSPYGEVIAMAMQGPIDIFFDAGMAGSASAPKRECLGAPEVKAQIKPQPPPTHPPASLSVRLGTLLISLGEASEARTNPKAASEGLKRYLRRQAEDKLRFAYQLDPAHYGNYNALHFFLTEPAIGTRPELTPSAAKLAEDTIQYCLRQDQDPRPALTAAAAATNILHLMFSDQHHPTPKYSLAQMRQCLLVLDHCLARYAGIANDWTESKQWELLSPLRIAECQERRHFIGKVRDAAEQTILRLEAGQKTEDIKTQDIKTQDRREEDRRLETANIEHSTSNAERRTEEAKETDARPCPSLFCSTLDVHRWRFDVRVSQDAPCAAQRLCSCLAAQRSSVLERNGLLSLS